ncbi:MAG: zf-HC2 domain-containing protein [Acidobacteriota bacterium]
MKCATARKRINDHTDGLLNPEQEAKLKRHLAACPECRELARDFEAIVEKAKSLTSLEPSPAAWPKILAGVRESGRESALPVGQKRGWLAALWNPVALRYAAAALALVAIVGLVVRLGPWRGAGGAKGSLAFTVAKLQEAQRYYEKAIQSLSEAIASQKNGMDPQLAVVFQRNLEAMDATIQACQNMIGKDPDNLTVRTYLLTAYREKVSFLEEMMGLKRASASPKIETMA